MDKYLVGITIGPVQLYIQESTKLKDLYNSSKIVSDTMEQIILKIKSQSEVELIYPNIEFGNNNLKIVADYSNYAIFTMSEYVDVNKVIENVYKGMVELSCQQTDSMDVFKLKELLHIFWSMKEFKDCISYSLVYEELIREISDLKNTYEFEQVIQEGQNKCLVCGKRNVFPLHRTTVHFNIQNEELCPQCLFKRKYSKGKSIESIYSIAISTWKKIYNTEIANLRIALENLCGKGKEDKYYNPQEIDRVICILNRCTMNIPKDLKAKVHEIRNDLGGSSLIKEEYVKKELIDKLKNIKQEMVKTYGIDSGVNVPIPNYEYCFIQVDVDDLGKIISYKYDKLKDAQQEISRLLTLFGIEIKESLMDKATIIYAGGDDILLVCSLEKIFDVVKVIDNSFSKVQNEYLNIRDDKQITYSMSITIAQCKEPMSYALAKTRSQLENVKERYNYRHFNTVKNGVSFDYIINSGKEICAYIKNDKLMKYINRCNNIKDVEKQKIFAYMNKFYEEFKGMKFNDITYDETQSLHTLLILEIRRLMNRSFKLNNKEEEINKKNVEYIQHFVGFISEVILENYLEEAPNCVSVDFENIINILTVYKKLCLIEEEV